MNTINQYIYAVIKNLPRKIQEEVKNELYDYIINMLPKDYKQSDVESVLTKLGDPSILAGNYFDYSKYRINNNLLPLFISLLKLLLVIVPISAVGTMFFSHLVSDESKEWYIVIQELFGVGITAILHTIFWTTGTFYIISRCSTKSSSSWNVKKLTPIPDSSKKYISKVNIFSEIGWSLVLLVAALLIIVMVSPSKIGIKDENDILVYLFNEKYLNAFIFLFLAVLLFTLIVPIIKLKKKVLDYKIFTLILIQNALVIIYFNIIVFTDILINSEFKTLVEKD